MKDGIDVGAGVVDSDYRGSVGVAPQSGLALKYGIDVGASSILITEAVWGVVLFNHDDASFVVNAGDRIAQMIFTPCIG